MKPSTETQTDSSDSSALPLEPRRLSLPQLKFIGPFTVLCIFIFAVIGYGLAFATQAGGGAILIAMPSLFLFSKVRTARQAFYGGLALGVAIYAPHLFFFFHVFGRMAILLFLIAGFPIGLVCLLLNFAHRRYRTEIVFWLTPMLWTGIEFFRSELYQLRFAWLLPGQSLVFLPGARWLFLGVYGVGFVMVLVGAMVISPKPWISRAGVAASMLIALLMYWPARTERDVAAKLHVAGIQFEAPDLSTVVEGLNRLAVAHPEAQILVLSEDTFAGPVPDEVCQVVKRHGRYLVAGGVKWKGDGEFYITAYVIDPNGKEIFSQAKSVPVQFMRDGLPAEHQQVWNSPWGKIGIAICYDLSYSRVMDELVRQGAQGLIIPTMDLSSWGEYERRMLHGRMAPLRSAEYGIPTFGVWSSGVSQLTDARGRIIATAEYPGQGQMIAGPFSLSATSHVPPDRPLAMASSIGTGLYLVILLIPTKRQTTPQ